LYIFHAAGVYEGHYKIKPRAKSYRGLGLRELPKIMRFPFNISATVEASDFKFGMQLGFGKAHHEITRRRKVFVALD